MQWVKGQVECFDAVSEMLNVSGKRRGVFLNSVAGSGKTTTMVRAIEILIEKGVDPEDILVLSFNRSIKDTMLKRVDQRINVKTFNSLGYMHTRRYYDLLGASLRVDQYNISKILFQKAKELEVGFLGKHDRIALYGVIGYMKNAGWISNKSTNFSDAAKIVGRKEIVDLIKSSDDFTIKTRADDDKIEKYARLCFEVLTACYDDNYVLASNTIDFDDQIWFAATKTTSNGSPITIGSKNKFVVVDECQDLSPTVASLIDRTSSNDCMLIMAGDRCQMIYGWRGSSNTVINKMIGNFNLVEINQNISFRCSKAVCSYVNKNIYNNFNVMEDAPEGNVVVTDASKFDPEILQPGDLVLSRNHESLIEFFIEAVEKGKTGVYAAKDLFNKAMENIIFELTENGHDENELQSIKLYEFLIHCLDLIEKLEDLIASGGKDHLIETLDEIERFTRILKRIGESLGLLDKSMRVFLASVEDVFSANKDFDYSQTKDNIVFTTIHQSKGLEADRVFIISNTDFDMVEELKKSCEYNNIRYVAATRAKSDLFIIHDKEQEEDNPENEHQTNTEPSLIGHH